jgi:hypothetical protein
MTTPKLVAAHSPSDWGATRSSTQSRPRIHLIRSQVVGAGVECSEWYRSAWPKMSPCNLRQKRGTPNLLHTSGASTFQQVDPVRIARERQLEADAGVIATSVSVDFRRRKNGGARWKSMLQWTASATLLKAAPAPVNLQGCAVPTKRPSLCVFLDVLQYPLQRGHP